MLDGTIATAFTDMTDFELFEELAYLDDAPATLENGRLARAMMLELDRRRVRRQAIEDLLW